MIEGDKDGDVNILDDVLVFDELEILDELESLNELEIFELLLDVLDDVLVVDTHVVHAAADPVN